MAKRKAGDMRKDTATRVKRTLTALLLMFVLSFCTAFADIEGQSDGTPAGGTQTIVTTDADGGDGEQPGDPGTGDPTVDPGTGETPGVDPPATEEPAVDEPAPVVKPKRVAKIVKRGKHYYYKKRNGKIRRKSGFVTVDDKIYYIRKGGRIRTNDTFKVKRKTYRADENGVIQTGVYKWEGKYYYSNSKGQWKKKEGFKKWKHNKYYIQKGGEILTNDGFVVDNLAYCADKKGRVTDIELDGDDSSVVKIARKQVGIMTGVKYWVWYYKTKFIDTDRTPWCGAFVAWCYNKAGLYNKISIAKKYGPLGYVPVYSRYANNYGKWLKNNKKAKGGDIIIFGRNMHVALVEGVYGDYIITIEGNAGPTAAWGCGLPGAVVRKIYRYDNYKIMGVIRP